MHFQSSTRLWPTPLLLTLALLGGAYPARAATLNVPSQYAKIQDAIDAASNGDTVLVTDGTYMGTGNWDLDFGGKSITVTSVHGASSTIIRRQGDNFRPHRGFYFHSGESASAVVSGFTIEDGRAPNNATGGAIYIGHNSSPTILNCVFDDDYAPHYGGAIYLETSAGSPTISGCTFTTNDAHAGGAIASLGGSLTVTDCTFNANQGSDYPGGAIYCGGSLALTNSTFVGNYANSNGMALGFYDTGNHTQTVTNCTFAANSHTDYGTGSVVASYSGSQTFTNDIFYDESANNAFTEFYVQNSMLNVTYCDVQGGDGNGNPYPGTGNIKANPHFVSDPNPGGGNYGNLHLKDGSPCAAAGTANGAPATDFDGNPRPNPPSIGAYDGATPDTAPPVTTISTSTGDIVLTAADPSPSSGIAATYNTLDGSAFALYVGPIHVYGAHDLTFYSVDNAGNKEAVKSAHVTIPFPVPHLSSLSPNIAHAGGAAFTLTVNGTGFTRRTVVKWNGSALTATFVSATQMTAQVPASYIANVGTATVKATNPTPGGGASNALTVTVNNSGPPVTTASLSGTTGNNGYYRGTVSITLSVTDPNGAGYVKGTFYKYDGGGYQAYSRPFILGSNGAHTVTFYSTDKGGESETPHSVTFSVDSTAPTTAHMLTDNAQGIKVTLSATDAGPSGVAATYYSVDSAAYQTYSGPVEVTGFGYHTVAFYSTDNAGNTEAAHTVQANINYPVPSTTSLSPASAQAGGPGFTLTVNGHEFNTGSVVYWNGTALATTFVAYQQVTAHVPASLIASVATASVTVVNPAPGGGTSNAQTFTITGTPLKVTVGTLSRASGVITANLVIQNISSQTVQNVQITAAQLGATATSTALPLALGTVTAGNSVNASLTFPGSAGASGTVKTLTVSGTYTGGTFTSSQSVTLP